MKRFNNILFFANPLDSAESALRKALSLYDLKTARITIVEVAPEMSAGFQLAGSASSEIREKLVTDIRGKTEALVESLNASDNINVKLLTGTPFIEVIREIIRGKYDLLIKPTEGGGRISRLLGSNDMHLLRKCPCPVWIVKPSRLYKHKKILAAVDPDQKAVNAELNQLIMSLASSMSAHDNAELHVVAGWELWGESVLRSRSHQTKLEQLRLDMKKANKHWLKELTSPFEMEGLKIHTHLLEGHADDVILKEVRKHRIDLIVMGTVGHVGIPGYFMGNTAEHILSDVSCSVLAIKPSGFSSPVTI